MNSAVARIEITRDSGDPSVVEQVRNGLVALEERLSAGYEMPGQHERGTSTAVLSEEQERLKREIEAQAIEAVRSTFTSARAAEREEDVRIAMASAFRDPTYAGFTGNRFVVDRWHGIQVGDDVAVAVLEAHQEYLVNAVHGQDRGSRIDQVRRWQVTLEKEDGAWRLVDQAQFALSGQG